MKKNKFSKLSVFAITLIAFFSLFSNSASALTAINVEKTDLSLALSYADLILEDFESSEGVIYSLNSTGVSAVGEIQFPPYLPLSGGNMLKSSVRLFRPGEWCYIEKSFSETKDLTAYNYIYCALSGKSMTSNLEARMTVITENGEYEYDTVLLRDTVNIIAADISDFKEKSGVTGVRIMIYNSAATLISGFEFAVDLLAASASGNLPSVFRFLSPDYTASEGSSVEGNGQAYIFSLKGKDPYIEPSAFFSPSKRVKMIFSGDYFNIPAEGAEQREIKIYYTTPSNPVFSEERVLNAEITGENTRQVVFTLPPSGISGIRICFTGETDSVITLHSVVPLPYYEAYLSSAGEITSVVISGTKDDIIVRGNISDSALLTSSAKLMLYEINGWEDEQIAPLLTYTPVLTIDAAEEFSFRFPLLNSDGNTRLYSKFLVAYSDGRSLTLLGSAKYISNPAILAEASVKRKSSTIKGLSGYDYSLLEKYGASVSDIEIEAEKLITLGASRYSFKIDGESVYFSEAYVEELDDKIKKLNQYGCEVLAYLTVKASGDERVDRYLLHPRADASKAGIAFNTADREGNVYFRAICEFLAGRYTRGENGSISRYALGRNVDLWGENYNIGNSGLKEFAFFYVGAMRIFNTACERNGLEDAVFMPVSGFWDRSLPASERMRADTVRLIEYITQMTSYSSDFNWNLICNPYPADTQEYYSSTESSADYTRVNFNNLAEFIRKAGDRKIIFDEKTSHTSNAENSLVTADYIHAYYACSVYENIIYYITDRSRVDFEILKYIDTRRTAEFAAQYGNWPEKIKSFEYEYVNTRLLLESGFSNSFGEGFMGSYVIGDFSRDADGWAVVKNGSSLAGGQKLLGREKLLVFKIGAGFAQEGRFSKKYPKLLDLSSSPYISFDVSVASLPVGVEELVFRVSFISGRNMKTFEGSVKSGEWNSIYCLIDDFEFSSSIDEILFAVLSPEGKNITDALAVIDKIKVHSYVNDSEYIKNVIAGYETDEGEHFFSPQNTPLVWSLISVALISMSLLAVRSVTRFARRPDDESPK